MKISRKAIYGVGVILLISYLCALIPQSITISEGQTAPPARLLTFATSSNILNYSTYLGGNSDDYGRGIAVASDGSCYVTGATFSNDFPTINAYDSTKEGDYDVFVTKFSATGSLLWSTYLGGSSFDSGSAVAVASDDSCYVIGETWSSNFPTKNAFDDSYNGGECDAFVTKFSATGSLLWSTFLGGSSSDFALDVAVAFNDSCYVIGDTSSSDFPTKNAFDSILGGNGDTFVAKYSTDGLILWSAFLGGSNSEDGFSVAVTSNDYCYVGGVTFSSDFPTLNAYDNTFNGENDAFITQLSGNGTILWSTFLGGSSYDIGTALAVASDNSCYFVGYTYSYDFPVTEIFTCTLSGDQDTFVTKFSTYGALIWSTCLNNKHGMGIACADDANCYITGSGSYVTKLSADSSLLWSISLGGDYGYDVTTTNNASYFVIGDTSSSDFPTENAFDNTLGGSRDAFVTGFNVSSTTSIPTRIITAYSILVLIVIMPIITLVLRKRVK